MSDDQSLYTFTVSRRCTIKNKIARIFLLGRAQPVIPPNLYSVMLMNIIAWGPQVRIFKIFVLLFSRECEPFRNIKFVIPFWNHQWVSPMCQNWWCAALGAKVSLNAKTRVIWRNSMIFDVLFGYILFIARCVTVPRRASSNASHS